jgi:hypothetical protein
MLNPGTLGGSIYCSVPCQHPKNTPLRQRCLIASSSCMFGATKRCGTTTGKRLAISNMKSIAWRSCVTNFSPASGDARAWGRSWWLSDPPSKKAVEPFADHAVALASEGLQTWAIINCDIPLA